MHSQGFVDDSLKEWQISNMGELQRLSLRNSIINLFAKLLLNVLVGGKMVQSIDKRRQGGVTARNLQEECVFYELLLSKFYFAVEDVRHHVWSVSSFLKPG